MNEFMGFLPGTHGICSYITKLYICMGQYFSKVKYSNGNAFHPRGGDLVSNMPVCVCPKVKEMGSFSASRE